jgi:hypothetical protein
MRSPQGFHIKIKKAAGSRHLNAGKIKIKSGQA